MATVVLQALLQSVQSSSQLTVEQRRQDEADAAPFVLKNGTGTKVAFAVSIGCTDTPPEDEFVELEHGDEVPLAAHMLRVQSAPASRFLHLRFPDNPDWRQDLRIDSVQRVRDEQAAESYDLHANIRLCSLTSVRPSGVKSITLASQLRVQNATQRRLQVGHGLQLQSL